MRVVVAVLLLWPLLAAAQGRVWTFQELVERSLASHPAVQARRSSAAAADSDLDAARWQRFPTPTFEAYSGGGSVPLGGPDSRLRVQQPLWTGGRITSGIDSAQSRKDAAGFAIGESRLDIALRVAAAYVEAARQQARFDHAVRSVAEHQRLLELIGRRVRQEVSPPVDQELAQSRFYQAVNDRSTIAQALRSALTQLAQLAGQPVERVAALRVDLAAAPASLDQALEQALANSPTLARVGAEGRAAEAEVESRRSVLWPQLGVRFERDFGGQVAGDRSRLMLVLEATPGAGLSAGSNIEAARSRQRALQEQLESAQRDLRERIGIDWAELTHARDRLGNAELARKTAADVFASFARQYTAGRKTWVDVMNAVRESTQAEFTLADAQAQVSGAALRLRLLTSPPGAGSTP
jgi:adhesin transport system outer membrane protein